MRRFRLAAIDLDGTLVDSAPDLAHCLGVAFAAQGLARPSEQAVRSWIGDGIVSLIERGLSAALDTPPSPEFAQATLQEFDSCYRQHLFTFSSLYPGVAETLSALRAGGMLLGCITNKREIYARKMLELAGISDHLTFIYGGDTFSTKKPDPAGLQHACSTYAIAPRDVVMIGDSHNDRDAARTAGAAFVLAAYGYVSADELSAPAYGVINAFSELAELLCGA